MNKELAKGQITSVSLPWRKKECSITEIIHFYVIIILMENTFGNFSRSLHKHYSSLKKTYDMSPGLGKNQFQTLYHAFIPSIEQIIAITDLLHVSFTLYVHFSFKITILEQLKSVFIVCVDESMSLEQRKKSNLLKRAIWCQWFIFLASHIQTMELEKKHLHCRWTLSLEA